jgi:hypothetical protein
MKKIILLGIVTCLLTACGPSRMSCYGKRCVDVTPQSVGKPA